ncbi:MAG: formyl transferase [Alphaproteobacteria bacterium]|jgi:methionyl-tRNA formyltransferase|nr:formyl transferase [Alphaproteobacteria bacterium]
MVKIAVFAYSLVGHACLKALVEAGETVVGVFTHPDAPGEPLWFPSVAQLAKDHGIPMIATEGPQDSQVLEALQKISPHLLFSFYYRKMIPNAILDIPHLGSFNMHGSLLPRYRGRAPINWAIVHGETETGATLHHMVQSADAGAIVDQETVPIGPTETAFDMTHKVSAAAVQVLRRQLPALKEGRAPALPQDASKATYFGGRTAKDSQIDWAQTPWQIHNLIRAVPYPYFPSAFTTHQGNKVEIRANRLPKEEARLENPAQPGRVVAQDKDGVRVACGNGRAFLDITALSCPFDVFQVGDVLG